MKNTNSIKKHTLDFTTHSGLNATVIVFFEISNYEVFILNMFSTIPLSYEDMIDMRDWILNDRKDWDDD